MKDPFQTGLSIEEIVNTPSKENGVDALTEFRLRIYGCELIQKASAMLRLYPLFSPFTNHDLTKQYLKLQWPQHKCYSIDFITELLLRDTMSR